MLPRVCAFSHGRGRAGEDGCQQGAGAHGTSSNTEDLSPSMAAEPAETEHFSGWKTYKFFYYLDLWFRSYEHLNIWVHFVLCRDLVVRENRGDGRPC